MIADREGQAEEMEIDELAELLTPIRKLTKDIKAASRLLSRGEARFLVDAYYTMQRRRIQVGNQVRALTESGEPCEVLKWYLGQSEGLEKEVGKALAAFADADPVGRWCLSICGIGPIITAGLLAHVDISKCPTVGHIWAFAGLDPTRTWERGKKRPHNAKLKTLCWKIGESFVKVKGRESDVYGHVYAQRKEYETAKNIAGDYADKASEVIGRTPKHAQAATYKEGRLPDGHVHARAKRYAVKLFLSHFHHVAYHEANGCEPPKPYIIEHGGHVHFLKPPNWPME